MKAIFMFTLMLSLLGCNMWAYRGTPYSEEVYRKTYFDIAKTTAYFPENISGKYNISCNCNGNWIDFKDTSSSEVYYFQFPSSAFDSCKTKNLKIYFWRKNNRKKNYVFTIQPGDWLNTNTKIKGSINGNVN